jgi:organic hydroperoxide reductase OsmC/OhrA
LQRARTNSAFTRRTSRKTPDDIHTTTAIFQGGREGHVHGNDGSIDPDLKALKKMDGRGGTGSNPE